jgi:hypothetical protein
MQIHHEIINKLDVIYTHSDNYFVWNDWFEFLETVGIGFSERGNLYLIQDKHKWLLAKIKYGI